MKLSIKEKLGQGNEAMGYQWFMMGLAVICIIALIIAFISSRGRVKPDPTIKSSLKDDLRDITRNRSWLILIIFLQPERFETRGN